MVRDQEGDYLTQSDIPKLELQHDTLPLRDNDDATTSRVAQT